MRRVGTKTRHALGSDAWTNNTNVQMPETDTDEWMDLNEYLAFCHRAHMTPLIGINYLSPEKYKTTNVGINHARACVKHVANMSENGVKAFKGAYYYIGNEDMHDKHIGGLLRAARLAARYADAMKSVDPTIKIFWNDNDADPSSVKTYLAEVKKTVVPNGSTYRPLIDGVEAHTKWPYGGSTNPVAIRPPTLRDWINEGPLRDHKRQRVHRYYAHQLRKAAAEAGFPNLLVANNEYGWALDATRDAVSNKTEFDNRYLLSLVMVDYLQELIIGGYDMTSFWDNHRISGPAPGSTSQQSLWDGTFDGSDPSKPKYPFNPVHFAWEMLKPVYDTPMLWFSSDRKTVLGFAAKSSTSFHVYLLNREQTAVPIRLQLKGTFGVKNSGPFVHEAMEDDSSGAIKHMGKRSSTGLTVTKLAVTATDASFAITLPALSYSHVELPRKPTNDSTPPNPHTKVTCGTVKNKATNKPTPKRLRVSWTASSAKDLLEYRLLRATQSGGPYRYVNMNLSPKTTVYDDKNLVSGVTYYYQVEAVDTSDNVSKPSNEASNTAP